jgi:type IV pilus assembly protein PilW
MNTANQRMNPQVGFSLVELMVAVVIGLIGTLVMFQLFAVSESQKRSTSGGGDAQQNGSIALFTLERDLRNTAHNMRPLIALGRPMYTWSNVNNAVLQPTVFRPILITPGTNFDSIDVAYSTSEGLSSPLPLMAPWDPAVVPSTINVLRIQGIELGDHIAICPPASADPREVCLRGEVTATNPLNNTLTLAATPYTIGSDSITPRFNPAAGFMAKVNPQVTLDSMVLPVSYPGDGGTASSTVLNLGPVVTRTYSVQNGQLTLNDGAVTTEFATGIVGMRAQYGLDTNNDRAVDAWVDPRGIQPNPRASYTPNHPSFLIGNDAQIAASWRMVIAARVAVVARSDNMEKDVVETRSTIPLWTNTTADPAPSYTVPSGDGSHYRYRVFETIVPFRNMIW